MSTSQPADAGLHDETPVPVAAGAGGSSSAVQPELLQQTKNEIRALVQEITHLSQSDIPLEQFYEEYLRRLVQALAAHGGAIWEPDSAGQLRLRYQINWPSELRDGDEAAQRKHRQLVENVAGSGTPTLVPPRSGAASDEQAGNPSDFLLILAVMGVERESLGVVEIFQRPGGGPTTQRGYLRFLVQMSELAADYLKNRRLRLLGDREQLWEALEQFMRSAHQSLDLRETAYTIVNESRRLIRCDRVSLTCTKGKRQNVLAISGLDAIDRRAEEVKRLGQLASATARAKRPLWYSAAAEELPPQIERPLQAYVDHSQSTMVAIIPLETEADEDGQAGRLLGTLVVEQLRDSRVDDGLRERVGTVAEHTVLAMSNCLEHGNLFLAPLWKALGNARVVLQVRHLPKTVLAVLVAAALIAALLLVPADFALSARGRLQPAERRDIFAHMDGVITEVAVRHQQHVEAGAVLARLMNHRLEAEITNLIGRKRATQERILAIKRSQLSDRLRIEEQNALDGELLELLQVELGIERELELVRRKRDSLVVRSPLAGQVVTWDVQGRLDGRPVQIGQSLMTVANPDGAWEVELYMRERRMGHIARRWKTGEPLRVTFVLYSHPDREFEGRVVEMDRKAEVQGEEGNTVRLRVALDKSQLPEVHSQTTVKAKVHCGNRPLGYVIFHELIETVQTNVLFWLS